MDPHKMIKSALLSFGISLLIATSLMAHGTIQGTTGLIEMPTAESLAFKQVGVGVDFKMGGKGTNQTDIMYYKFNFGSIENLEMGFTGGSFLTEGVFVNAKYFIMSDNQPYPLSLALGVENIGSLNDTNAYFVASKKFQGGFTGHFGFKANFKETLDAAAMIGAEYMVDNRFSLLGELTGETEFYIFNVGLRYYFDPDFVLKTSILDLTKNKSEDTLYTVGISILRFM